MGHLAVEDSRAAASHNLVDPSARNSLAGASAVSADVLYNHIALVSSQSSQTAEECRTYGATLAEGDAAAVSERGLPDPRLHSETNAMRAAAGPRLLGALVVVLAVDANPVGGRGAHEGSGGEEDGGELHFGKESKDGI